MGWAGALLVNEQTGQLIDGHLRLESVPPQTPVPVLIGSWTPQQEREILLTFDPIAAMAEADEGVLEELLKETDLAGALAAVGEDLAELLEQRPAGVSDQAGGKGSAGEKTIGDAFHVICECQNEREQQEIYELLKKNNYKCRVTTVYA